jgi:hypothetical protein
MDALARRRLRFVRIQEQIEDIAHRDEVRRDIARLTHKQKVKIPAHHEPGDFTTATLYNPTPIDEGDANPLRRNIRWKDTIVVRWDAGKGRGEESGMQSLMHALPEQGEAEHSEASIRDLFEKFGKIESVRLSHSRGKAVMKFKWLEDALNVASMNIKAFNFQTTLDFKIRSFTYIGFKEPRVPPPLPPQDKYDSGKIMMDRAHQRFIAMDALSTLCHSTIPQSESDPHFNTVDLRHQYIDDEGVSMICRALMSNRTVTSLNLSHNRITDHGARMVLKLAEGHVSLIHCPMQHQRPEIGFTMELEPDMKVEARYDGKHAHYPGTVMGKREDNPGIMNDRYDVLYDDGDSEHNIPRGLIRVPIEISQHILDKIEVILRDHKDCAPVGMSTGRIRDNQLAKSGGWLPKLKNEISCNDPFNASRHDPQNPRIGIKWVHPDGSNRNNCFFVGGCGSNDHWAQLTLDTPALISGVATMGRGDKGSWVETYKVLYKPAVKTQFPIGWSVIKNEKGTTRIFNGNTDNFGLVKHHFFPVKAQILRIVPMTVHKSATLRFEFFQVMQESMAAVEAHSVPCKCTVNLAGVWCDACATPYCLGCDLHAHRSGPDAAHVRVHIDEYIREMHPEHTGAAQVMRRASNLRIKRMPGKYEVQARAALSAGLLTLKGGAMKVKERAQATMKVRAGKAEKKKAEKGKTQTQVGEEGTGEGGEGREGGEGGVETSTADKGRKGSTEGPTDMRMEPASPTQPLVGAASVEDAGSARVVQGEDAEDGEDTAKEKQTRQQQAGKKPAKFGFLSRKKKPAQPVHAGSDADDDGSAATGAAVTTEVVAFSADEVEPPPQEQSAAARDLLGE